MQVFHKFLMTRSHLESHFDDDDDDDDDEEEWGQYSVVNKKLSCINYLNQITI